MSNDGVDPVVSLYDRTARAWDEARRRARPDGETGWMRRFAELAGTGGAVLDIGCGSGEPVAAQLIAEGLTVTGVDSSPALIELCRSRFPDQNWIVADMRGLDLERAFGGVLAWHSFFHLAHDDQRAMFATFARHARPGAPLMFTSGSHHGVSIGTWQGESLYHASLAQEEYRILLKANGFTVIDHAPKDATTGDATIWLARRESN